MAKQKSETDTSELEQLKADLKDLKKTGTFKEVKELQEKITALKNPNSVAILYTKIRKGLMEIRYASIDNDKNGNIKKTRMVEHLKLSAVELEQSLVEE